MRKYYLLCLSVLCVTQAQAYKFPAQKISAYDCGAVCESLSHEPMHLEWSVSDNTIAHQKLKPQKSYSYKKKVTMAELQAGFTIDTLGPEAVIRISPLNGGKLPDIK